MVNEVTAALARPSSTVVLVREAHGAPELFMVQRHAATTFGGSYAFPGGLVDGGDRGAHAHCGGLTASKADELLQLCDCGLDYYSAAVRELFEESGVLLARDADGAWAFHDRPAQRSQLREQLIAGKRTWPELLREHHLQLACETLHYIGHWETPLKLPRRFSTRFFMAALPGGQQAQHDERELTDGRWISAADVLTLARDDSMEIRFPTLKNLQLIAEHGSLPALLDWADSRAAGGIECVRPEIIEVDGERRAVLPGDPGHPLGKNV